MASNKTHPVPMLTRLLRWLAGDSSSPEPPDKPQPVPRKNQEDDAFDPLRFLNETAFELVDLPDEHSIYSYMGKTLYDLLDGDVIVLVNQVTPDGEGFIIQGVYGLDDSLLERVFNLLGYSPIGKTYTSDPLLEPFFARGTLIQFEDGLVEFAKRIVPPVISRQLVRLLNLGNVYLIGMHKDKQFFAGVQFYLRGDKTIDHPDLIEAFIYQASSALQRLHAIESWRKTEGRYRSLFEQSNDAVFIFSLDGTNTMSNQRAADMTGYKPEELIGLSNHDLIVADHRTHADNVLERLLAGEIVPPYERIFRHKDGHHIPAEVNVALVHDADGKPIYVQSIVREISERKKVEQSLRESEQRYRNMFEKNRAVKLLIDPETGSIVDANSAAAHFYGYPRETLLTMNVHDINMLSQAEIQQEMDKARSEQRTVFYFRHRLSSGDTREVEVFSGPITLNGKQMLYSIIQDVTGRKQAEANLIKREQRLQDIIRGTRAGTWEWNVQTGETIFNDRWAEIVGYTLEELAPISIQTWMDLTHPDDLAESDKLLQKHFAGELDYYEYEARMKHKDGHWVWVLDRGTVMEWTDDGQPLLMFGTHVDITQRVETEAALRQSEGEFRTLTEKSPDLIVRLTQDGTHLYANPAFANVMGLSIDEIIGKRNADLGVPDDIVQSLAAIRNRIYRTGQPAEMELQYPVREELRDFHLRLIPEFDAHGQVSTIISIARDVTDRQRAQQHEFALQLEKERRDLLNTFFQNAAHEFRTPLSTISTSAYLITRMDDPQRRLEKTEQIQSQVERITQLVNTLQLMTQLESTPTDTLYPINIVALLESACQAIADTCRKQHHLNPDIEAGMPLYLGDADQLRNALDQVLNNACRFTPVDGEISVKAGHTQDHIWIEICDDGVGIVPHDLPHIFDTFWRKDDAHSTPGFGLGLPIAKKIIEQHTGTITVTSVLGQGTTVRIVLPRLIRNRES